MRVQRDYNTKTRNFVNGVHATFCINSVPWMYNTHKLLPDSGPIACANPYHDRRNH